MNLNTVKNIFKKHGININKITRANNSYSSNVYIVSNSEKKYILKCSNSKEKIELEYICYNHLKQFLSTAESLYMGKEENEYYNIITFIEGKNIFDEDCNNLTKEEIKGIGGLLADLHNSDLLYNENDFWIEHMEKNINMAKRDLDNIIGLKNNRILCDFITLYIDKNIKNKYDTCMLHMDFRVGNLIFDNEKISLIDLESVKNGDYVFDFVKIKRIFNKKNFEILMDGYTEKRKINSDFEDKLKFYSLFDAYTSIHWCVCRKMEDSKYYKINLEILQKYLEEISNGKWNI